MPILTGPDAYYYTKMRISEESDDISNENELLEEIRRYKSTKNAILEKKAENTRKINELKQDFASFRDFLLENDPRKTPVSTPDPNDAFERHKHDKLMESWKKRHSQD